MTLTTINSFVNGQAEQQVSAANSTQQFTLPPSATNTQNGCSVEADTSIARDPAALSESERLAKNAARAKGLIDKARKTNSVQSASDGNTSSKSAVRSKTKKSKGKSDISGDDAKVVLTGLKKNSNLKHYMADPERDITSIEVCQSAAQGFLGMADLLFKRYRGQYAVEVCNDKVNFFVYRSGLYIMDTEQSRYDIGDRYLLSLIEEAFAFLSANWSCPR